MSDTKLIHIEILSTVLNAFRLDFFETHIIWNVYYCLVKIMDIKNKITGSVDDLIPCMLCT